jgi:hypothetical protein
MRSASEVREFDNLTIAGDAPLMRDESSVCETLNEYRDGHGEGVNLFAAPHVNGDDSRFNPAVDRLVDENDFAMHAATPAKWSEHRQVPVKNIAGSLTPDIAVSSAVRC